MIPFGPLPGGDTIVLAENEPPPRRRLALWSWSIAVLVIWGVIGIDRSRTRFAGWSTDVESLRTFSCDMRWP
jgi:hypothetical protein